MENKKKADGDMAMDFIYYADKFDKQFKKAIDEGVLDDFVLKNYSIPFEFFSDYIKVKFVEKMPIYSIESRVKSNKSFAGEIFRYYRDFCFGMETFGISMVENKPYVSFIIRLGICFHDGSAAGGSTAMANGNLIFFNIEDGGFIQHKEYMDIKTKPR